MFLKLVPLIASMVVCTHAANIPAAANVLGVFHADDQLSPQITHGNTNLLGLVRRDAPMEDGFAINEYALLPHENLVISPLELLRSKRRIRIRNRGGKRRNHALPKIPKTEVNIHGNGSQRQGVNIHADARSRLWRSKDGRNSLDGAVQYDQHFGCPPGNSRPAVGGGVIFTRRF